MTANRTVLVVDDDADVREQIAAALRDELGCTVLEAQNGAEALSIALAGPLSAIVLDQRMPGMTGAEVVRSLRERGSGVPIVLVTAARDVGALARDLGLELYLGKPFGLDQLLAVVERALGSQPG